MKKEAQKKIFCPYLYPYHMENYFDFYLMPYNYILDAGLLPRFGNLISGSILIFDEAHNVADSAC